MHNLAATIRLVVQDGRDVGLYTGIQPTGLATQSECVHGSTVEHARGLMADTCRHIHVEGEESLTDPHSFVVVHEFIPVVVRMVRFGGGGGWLAVESNILTFDILKRAQTFSDDRSFFFPDGQFDVFVTSYSRR